MPARKSHGDASDDKAGTETDEDLDAMLYYHRVGTPQCQFILTLCFSWILTICVQTAEDVLVMKDASNRDWMWGTQVTELDGRYVALHVNKDTSRVRRWYLCGKVESDSFVHSETSSVDRRPPRKCNRAKHELD